MNVIIANEDYETNFGDIAMLQVSVNRIFRQYPTANIYIFTKHPDKLAISCPKTIPIHPIIRKRWLNARFLPIPLRLIPMKFHKIIGEIELLIKLRCPEMANFSLKIIRKLKPNELDQPFDFFSLVKNSELVISSGGGFLNDIFLSTKKELFYTLYIAQQLGKKTAMFGQGIGPIDKPQSDNKIRAIFSRLNLLTIREDTASPKYAEKLGVSSERIINTGDDAIEIALEYEGNYSEKECIGVNIRNAHYAGDFQEKLSSLCHLFNEISEKYRTRLIPVPISIADPNSDLETTRAIFPIEESEYQIAKSILTTRDLIKQVDRCKVVVTGSYHAGVFALSRGIPVIALIGSDYYAIKFSGLASQFNEGCTIIRYESPNLKSQLRIAIEKSMDYPEDLKQKLINRAHKQMRFSQMTLDQFLSMKIN